MSQNREEYNYESQNHGLQDLSDYLSRVLAADAVASDRSLLFFIRRKLLQYNLEGHLTIDDILHEAFLRTQKSIKNGEVVQCLPAWMNRVCFYIICERSREFKSRQSLDEQLRVDSELYANIDPIFNSSIEKIGSLLSSWEALKESDRRLLISRHVEKYSWKEIATKFSQAESKKITEQTIRKRGERALSKLRVSFRKAIAYDDSGLQEEDRKTCIDKLRSHLDE